MLPGSYTLTVSKAGFGQRGRLSMVALSGSVAFQNAVARLKQGTFGRFMTRRSKGMTWKIVEIFVFLMRRFVMLSWHESAMCFFSILILVATFGGDCHAI